MKLEMQFKDYLQAMKAQENSPLSLEAILQPFGIAYLSDCSKTVMIGHMLDLMVEQCKPHTVIDPIDVAQAAWELDIQGADMFLDEAPMIMLQMARAQVA